MQVVTFIVPYYILLHLNTVLQQSAKSLFQVLPSYKFSKGNSFSRVILNIYYIPSC